MKVLQAHKYYWHRDGASNYVLYLSKLLSKAGHTAIPFGMKSKNNLKMPYQRFFVSEMDISNPSKLSFKKKLKYASRMIYSTEAKRKMERLLDKESVDMVHLHNIYHHISPSILRTIKKHGIPIVMTLHDYKLLCPNYSMYHHGEVHEEDARGLYLSCIANKCIKDSYLQSTFDVFQMIIHNKIMRYYDRYIDKFIAPSQFMQRLCFQFGWDKKRFVHIPHPIDIQEFSVHRSDRGYVAYIGRLSEEKGLDVLLSVAKMTPEVKYKIIGDGPERKRLEERVKKEFVHVNVEFEGFKTGKDLNKLIQNARIIAIPSLWYENYPLSVLEAKAMGKVVIASTIGGIPELLPHSMLVTPGDIHALAKKISLWYSMPLKKRNVVGAQLRAQVEKINNPKTHLQAIEQLYTSLLGKRR